jgi:PKD repeat protein
MISEVDPTTFPPEADPIAVSPSAQELDSVEPFTESRLGIAADDGSVIDVLVVYTSDALSAQGGLSNMLDLIDEAVAEANVSYANSGIQQRLNLVHTAEVTFAESGDLSTDLARLKSSSDGYGDEAHTLRDAYCADVVVLIVDVGNACGIGYQLENLMSYNRYYAFCVVPDHCAVAQHSFAHELGHLMGAQHDRAHSSREGVYDYSYGYIAPDYSFRTVMAYPSGGAPRILNWSNPEVEVSGWPTGIAAGESDSADNATTLNNTAPTVAGWRQSCIAAPPSADFTADATSGLRPLLVTFTDASTGDISSYYWEFGDGAGSTEANPVHEYQEAGTYTVSLTVDGPNGSDTLYRNDYIQVYELHDADTDDPSGSIDGSEVNRILAYWRAGAYHCDETGQDGYAPYDGDSSCERHCADYQEPYWALDGSETSRVLAYWRAGGYHVDETGVDGYAPGSESSSQSAGTLGSSESNISARHSVDADHYQPGGLLTVETQFEYSGGLLSLMWRPVLPAGWEIQSVSGDGSPEFSDGEILWTGTLPSSPVNLSYTVRVPAGETEDRSIRDEVFVHLSGDVNPVQLYAAPDSILLAADKPFNPSGIYKSSDLSTNVFLQTYDTGSMLILFTSDLVTFHVFLDPDWSDGIVDIPDLAANGHLLSIQFTDESTALATVTYADQTVDDWQISRAFDASRSADAPDGIYKTAQENMSAYV